MKKAKPIWRKELKNLETSQTSVEIRLGDPETYKEKKDATRLRIGHEARIIYVRLRKVKEDQREEMAKKIMEEEKQSHRFVFIGNSHLSDRDIYFWNEGNKKRDFIGKLIGNIMQQQFLEESFDYQKEYKKWRDQVKKIQSKN